MFTFIYSPRVGTPAAKMPDPYTCAQKQVLYCVPVAAANRISEESTALARAACSARASVDVPDGRGDHPLTARIEARPPSTCAGTSSSAVRGREDHRQQHLGALYGEEATHGGTDADEAAIL